MNLWGIRRSPMKTVILHIGRHKTGTTSIQEFLSDQAPALARRGVCYPRAGRGAVGKPDEHAHHALALMLANRPRVNEIEAMRADLFREVGDAHTIAISSEVFQNISDLAPLQALFKDSTVIVVCYLREMLSYAASAYAEEIKATSLVSDFPMFAAWFARAVHYHNFAHLWGGSFKDIRLRLYDESGADVLPDFLRISGLEQWTSADDAPPRRSNPSISGNAIAFKLLVNVLNLHTSPQKDVLQELAREYPQFRGPFRIPTDTALMRVGDENNAFLRRQFGNVPMRDFDQGHKIMDPLSWERDFQTIADFYCRREFAAFKTAELMRHPVMLAIKLMKATPPLYEPQHPDSYDL